MCLLHVQITLMSAVSKTQIGPSGHRCCKRSAACTSIRGPGIPALLCRRSALARHTCLKQYPILPHTDVCSLPSGFMERSYTSTVPEQYQHLSPDSSNFSPSLALEGTKCSLACEKGDRSKMRYPQCNVDSDMGLCTAEDCPADHAFKEKSSQVSRRFQSAVLAEWKSLAANLPSSIWVRGYESRQAPFSLIPSP